MVMSECLYLYEWVSEKRWVTKASNQKNQEDTRKGKWARKKVKLEENSFLLAEFVIVDFKRMTWNIPSFPLLPQSQGGEAFIQLDSRKTPCWEHSWLKTQTGNRFRGKKRGQCGKEISQVGSGGKTANKVKKCCVPLEDWEIEIFQWS